MRFVYGRQDMPDAVRAQENCFLMGNGLGGYSSLSAAFSMTRCDHGLLVAARVAPNDRISLVGRLQETLVTGGTETFLSTQEFADGTCEDGWKHLSSLTVEDTACWIYDVRGVRVTREVGVPNRFNAVQVVYHIENRTDRPCTLRVRPYVTGFAKSTAPVKKWDVSMTGKRITTGGFDVYMSTDGEVTQEAPDFRMQSYRHDAPDGRPEKGLAVSVCSVAVVVAPGKTGRLSVGFSNDHWDCERDCLLERREHIDRIRRACSMVTPEALQLAYAADAFIARRDSTGGKTILAGYPFFGDWGRDTMIALPGCCLSTGRYDDAASILCTFLQYEKDGLVPNLFPEGDQAPMYNTADAALLLVNVIYTYVQKTGHMALLQEAWPTLQRIMEAYRTGTRHGIRMDDDGLICAGEGLDQVTWMDVRVGEILPTPRHGKPVEINAYWYSALRVMAQLAAVLGKDGSAYAAQAEKTGESFVRAFWREDAQCLRDVVSGTAADDQIRCNQIWAVTQPFTALSPEQEKAVVDTVYRHLYTPCGLRTLSPEDPQYHPVYEGEQKERDMAYHQGTTWVFPLGAYYLAYLKTRGNTREAAAHVRQSLLPIESALREGCIGQLPEIYDGDMPSFSRGCFAQAWSVGEMLRVYEALEEIERKTRFSEVIG